MSYRRQDSAGQTGRLKDILVEELGDDCVFMDVDRIPLGSNFVDELRQEVAGCGLLFVIIGNQCLSLRDSSGRRRIDNPSDFVRIEVVTALQARIPVVPILLDGIPMPAAKDLPADMEELVLRNGIEIDHTTFRPDVERLVDRLKPQVGNVRRLYTFELLLFSFCAWMLGGLLSCTIIGVALAFL